jgi:hypothetical protein
MFSKRKKTTLARQRAISMSEIREALFPTSFHSKFLYLGSPPFDEEDPLFKEMEPLVVFLDYRAKPNWCPRWCLRILHLFGNHNSPYRVRNRMIHNFLRKLTQGIQLTDWKTKWTHYDLRISLFADRQCQELADAIESHVYEKGKRESLVQQIRTIDVSTQMNRLDSIELLEQELKRLKINQGNKN